MQIEEVQAAIQAAISDSEVQAKFEGSHAHLLVISPAFAGASPVKRQQMVYAALADAIASGAIHAVHMKTLTPAEYQQQA